MFYRDDFRGLVLIDELMGEEGIESSLRVFLSKYF